MINIGGNDVQEVWVGGNEVQEVWVGSNKIFPADGGDDTYLNTNLHNEDVIRTTTQNAYTIGPGSIITFRGKISEMRPSGDNLQYIGATDATSDNTPKWMLHGIKGDPTYIRFNYTNDDYITDDAVAYNWVDDELYTVEIAADREIIMNGEPSSQFLTSDITITQNFHYIGCYLTQSGGWQESASSTIIREFSINGETFDLDAAKGTTVITGSAGTEFHLMSKAGEDPLDMWKP